jgi:hypothetical protein
MPPDDEPPRQHVSAARRPVRLACGECVLWRCLRAGRLEVLDRMDRGIGHAGSVRAGRSSRCFSCPAWWCLSERGPPETPMPRATVMAPSKCDASRISVESASWGGSVSTRRRACWTARSSNASRTPSGARTSETQPARRRGRRAGRRRGAQRGSAPRAGAMPRASPPDCHRPRAPGPGLWRRPPATRAVPASSGSCEQARPARRIARQTRRHGRWHCLGEVWRRGIDRDR